MREAHRPRAETTPADVVTAPPREPDVPTCLGSFLHPLGQDERYARIPRARTRDALQIASLHHPTAGTVQEQGAGRSEQERGAEQTGHARQANPS